MNLSGLLTMHSLQPSTYQPISVFDKSIELNGLSNGYWIFRLPFPSLKGETTPLLLHAQ
jgi:hypothetical protein